MAHNQRSSSPLTKIVVTPGPTSRSFSEIAKCLEAGMSVALFDFSWGDDDYHQQTLDSLKYAIQMTNKSCAVMLDTAGPELRVINRSLEEIILRKDAYVTITPDQDQLKASSDTLPIDFDGLSKAVLVGDTISVGKYLLTGSETSSVLLKVESVSHPDVRCLIKNSTSLIGSSFVLHVSRITIDRPTLSENDKNVIRTWGVRNKIDFLSLSHTRSVDDVREARHFLSRFEELSHTQIFAKIEEMEACSHFQDILHEADGIILSRGIMSLDIPPEQLVMVQKSAIHKCNMAGKPVVVTGVLDSMTVKSKPNYMEATDLANAVFDGIDAVILGAETHCGMHLDETISVVGDICVEAEKCFNQESYFRNTLKFVGEPMSLLEDVASSVVRRAIDVNASVIISCSSSGKEAMMIAKYRPPMPILSFIHPGDYTINDLRQSLIIRGVLPVLIGFGPVYDKTVDPVMKGAVDFGKSTKLIKSGDKVVVFQEFAGSVEFDTVQA